MLNELRGLVRDGGEQAISSTPRTLLERLHSEKRGLEERLARVNDVLAALDANPAIADVVEKLSRV